MDYVPRDEIIGAVIVDAPTWIGSRLDQARDALDLVRHRYITHAADLQDAREVAANVGTVSTALLIGGLICMRNGIDVPSIVALVGGAHVTGRAVGIYVEELLSIFEKKHDRHQ